MTENEIVVAKKTRGQKVYVVVDKRHFMPSENGDSPILLVTRKLEKTLPHLQNGDTLLHLDIE
jgi:hypothetical protein